MGSNQVVVNEALFFEVPDSKMPKIMKQLEKWKIIKPRKAKNAKKKKSKM